MSTTELVLINNIFIAIGLFPICIKKDEHTQERDFSSSRCAIYLFVVAAISKMIWS